MERADFAGLGVAAVGHGVLLAALSYGLSLPAGEIEPSVLEVSFADEVAMTSAAPAAAEPAPAGRAPDLGPPEEAAGAPAPLARAPATDRAPPLRSANAPPGDRAARQPRLGDDLLEGIGRDPDAAPTPRPAAAMTGAARASINAAIRRALLPCERQPLPAPDAAAIRVRVRVNLRRDGGLASAEVTDVLNDDPRLRIYERRMQDLALAVIRGCTPIRGLPSELYDVPRGWRQFPYEFDPRHTR